MTPATLRKIALSLDGAHEEPHFERTSFRVGKKIFATMTLKGDEAMVRVSPPARALELLESEPDVFFSYGTWTTRGGCLGVRLRLVGTSQMKKLVTEAWQVLAAKRPAKRRAKRP